MPEISESIVVGLSAAERLKSVIHQSKSARNFLDSDEGRLTVIDYNLEKEFGFQEN
jgi:hypothetical protein